MVQSREVPTTFRLPALRNSQSNLLNRVSGRGVAGQKSVQHSLNESVPLALPVLFRLDIGWGISTGKGKASGTRKLTLPNEAQQTFDIESQVCRFSIESLTQSCFAGCDPPFIS